MIRNFFCKSLMLIYFINHGKSVPIDYCFHSLDRGDCGLKPTPVFTYYRSGSRCEIEYWRGCPTANKFDNEFTCSHYCIGKLWDRADDNDVGVNSVVDFHENEGVEIDECRVAMNEDDCGIKGEFKYTFVNDLCIKVAWKGCESQNLFDDELTCVNTCNPQTNVDDLNTQLQELPMDDINVINNILDNVMADNTTEFVPKHKVLLLHMKITEKPTTEATTKLKTTTVETKTVKTEAAKSTSEAIETTSEVIETTSEVTETTSEVIETTSEGIETTVEVTETMVKTEVTTPNMTTTSEGSTPVTTTEGTGSVEEVISI